MSAFARSYFRAHCFIGSAKREEWDFNAERAENAKGKRRVEKERKERRR
jgi:hypothetical protein